MNRVTPGKGLSGANCRAIPKRVSWTSAVVLAATRTKCLGLSKVGAYLTVVGVEQLCNQGVHRRRVLAAKPVKSTWI